MRPCVELSGRASMITDAKQDCVENQASRSGLCDGSNSKLPFFFFIHRGEIQFAILMILDGHNCYALKGYHTMR